jgi:hypothetical protein
MEVVVLTAIASQGAITIIDIYARRRAKSSTPRPTPSSSSLPTLAASQLEPDSSAVDVPTSAAESLSRTRPTDVQILEARLKDLKARARTLTSADKFVQYARVTREASAVEVELNALKGNLPWNFQYCVSFSIPQVR